MSDSEVSGLREEAYAVAERRYYDDQTGTWCVTAYDAFASGAEWAVERLRGGTQ